MIKRAAVESGVIGKSGESGDRAAIVWVVSVP
jgi:hypothetical protein